MSASFDPATVHERLAHVKWLIGSWKSVEGEVMYPTMKEPVKIIEILEISHKGNPVFNYRTRTINAGTGQPMYEKEGFIMVSDQPEDHTTVALLLVHANGVAEISEGTVDVNAKSMELHSNMNKIQTPSFVPQSATQMKRTIQRTDDDTLVQTLQMATPTTELTDLLKTAFKLRLLSVRNASIMSFDQASFDPTSVHERLAHVKWLIGNWKSVEGEVMYPTMKEPVKIIEILEISHKGNPVFNYRARAINAETGKPMHEEEGFIKVSKQPEDHTTVALLLAHANGVADISEGTVDVNAKSMELHSHMNKIQTPSFVPQTVTQMKRVIQRTDDDTLVQTLQMATPTTELTDHIRTVFKLISIHVHL
uniref:THAP4-like heme-binding beta-barrel domain-containing protein n=1 Tax=Plectus sambesii TaxID=2011161 RepID=A0A914XKU8_9BILA